MSSRVDDFGKVAAALRIAAADYHADGFPNLEVMMSQALAALKRLVEGEPHTAGCPAIADDESDYKYLYDAGHCACSRAAIMEKMK